MSTGASKHFALPYGTLEARATLSTHTHTHIKMRGSVSNNGTGDVCVCVALGVCWSGGGLCRDIGGPLFQAGRQKCWEGAMGKSRGS